jgi:hypothetical protein
MAYNKCNQNASKIVVSTECKQLLFLKRNILSYHLFVVLEKFSDKIEVIF